MEKAWELYLLLVPRTEAFALPNVVNEQRRSPRRYVYTSPYTDIRLIAKTQQAIPVKGCEKTHPGASTVAMLKTTFESCEVSVRQEQSAK